MDRLLSAFVATFVILIFAVTGRGQQTDPPKKTDPDKQQKKGGGLFDLEQLKKLTDQLAGKDGPLNSDQMKKLLEKAGVIDGKFDPEQLKKTVDELTGKGGVFDIEQIKKQMEKVGYKDGKFDPDQLKKFVNDLSGKGGQFDPDELQKLFEKLGVADGKFDPEQFKKMVGDLIGSKLADKGKTDGKDGKVEAAPPKKDKTDDKKGAVDASVPTDGVVIKCDVLRVTDRMPDAKQARILEANKNVLCWADEIFVRAERLTFDLQDDTLTFFGSAGNLVTLTRKAGFAGNIPNSMRAMKIQIDRITGRINASAFGSF